MKMETNSSETLTKSKKAYRPHPYSERLMVVSLYKQGWGSKRISCQLDVDDSMVRSWLRKYREHGEESLRPYVRMTRPKIGKQHIRRMENENQFQTAFQVFSSTLEPVASITRRYNLDYHSFRYHVQRYHPELVEKRNKLKVII